MKKVWWLVLVLVLGMTSLASAKRSGLWGGFWHFGMSTFYSPQSALRTALEAQGYTGMSDFGVGFTYGGGGLINSVYIGGWGSFDFNSSDMVNNSAGKTLNIGDGGRGGVELGYAIPVSQNFTLIPSLSLIWGGEDLTFNTNIAFTDYINNPVDFSPGFYFQYMSLGVGVNALLHGKFAGAMVKVMYLYALNSSWGPAHFSGAPAVGQHSVMASVEFAMGGWHNAKEFRKDMEYEKHNDGKDESIPLESEQS